MSDSSFFSRRSAPRFVATFLALVAVCYFLYVRTWDTAFVESYLRWNAWASWQLLRPFYDDVLLSGTVISGGFAVQVDHGCDAFLPISTYLAGVLAFPSRLAQKLWGLGLGLLALLLLNFVRIASLFSIGRHAPDFFDVMHGTVWQAGFVLVAGILWSVWARRVVPEPATQSGSE